MQRVGIRSVPLSPSFYRFPSVILLEFHWVVQWVLSRLYDKSMA